MAAFVDASFVLAYLHRGQPHHQDAQRLWASAREERLGALYSSDYSYDETVTAARRKFGKDGSIRADRFLREPGLFHVLRVEAGDFDAARELFLAELDRGLSFTDCTIIVHCRTRNIRTILSFDKGFDGILPRNDVPAP